MSGLRYGSLFSGAGGLDLAVEDVFGATAAWHCEQDPHASKVLAAHWPGVPNLGDITAVDWTRVEPVDVLCGGFPCQDVSTAGRGAGITEGTRSGLWYSYADAIRHLRPRLVVVENVRALLVRGLDIVLGSLAGLGYDATWTCLRASDVGAPHRRDRVFLAAAPADALGVEPERRGGPGVLGSTQVGDEGPNRKRQRVRDAPGGRRPTGDLLPTPRARDVKGRGYGDDLPTVATLLPSPAAADGTGGRRALDLEWSGGTAYRPSGAKASVSLREAVDLLPTPTATDGTGSRGHRPDGSAYGPTSGTTLTDAVTSTDWGRYAPAIARWEPVVGRPAPHPVDDRGRLNPLLPEWMMDFPEGWVTDHVARSPALKIAGNAVVRRQAATALGTLLGAMQHTEAATDQPALFDLGAPA